jgi:hypothetical protein
MERVVIYAARRHMYRKLAVGLILLAIGAGLLAAQIATWVGWGTSVIALQVRDPERFIRRLSPGRQFIARKALEAGLPGLYLTLVGTDADPARVAESIRRRVRVPQTSDPSSSR